MSNFTFKDLRNVYIMAYSDITIGDITYKADEVITSFNSVKISNWNEIKNFVTAHGGYDDRPLVMWEQDKGVAFNFSQGVFSKEQFGLMENSKFITNVSEDTKEIRRHWTIGLDSEYFDRLTSDDTWYINLPDATEKIKDFAVKDRNRKEISFGRLQLDNKLTITIKADDSLQFPLIIDYKDIVIPLSQYIIGQPFYNCFYKLQANTIMVDDEAGEKVYYLIEVPKLQIVSSSSIVLGRGANPVVPNFEAIAFPVGNRRNSKTIKFTELPSSVAFD